jgi:hypothetical protein
MTQENKEKKVMSKEEVEKNLIALGGELKSVVDRLFDAVNDKIALETSNTDLKCNHDCEHCTQDIKERVHTEFYSHMSKEEHEELTLEQIRTSMLVDYMQDFADNASGVLSAINITHEDLKEVIKEHGGTAESMLMSALPPD